MWEQLQISPFVFTLNAYHSGIYSVQIHIDMITRGRLASIRISFKS